MAADDFAEQLLELVPYLRRLAWRLSDRPADGEDLVQDTIERALRYRDHFDGRNLQGWLGTLMHNRAMDLRRRAQLRRAEQLVAHHHPSPLDVERQVLARVDLQRILRTEPVLAIVILRSGMRQSSGMRSRIRRARARARRIVA